jgi:hypothetical protein
VSINIKQLHGCAEAVIQAGYQTLPDILSWSDILHSVKEAKQSVSGEA